MQNKQHAEFNIISRIMLLILLMTSLSACAGLTLQQQQPGNSLSVGNNSSITGFIVEKDGLTPIYGATIALLNNAQAAGNPIQREESSQECTSPTRPNVNYVCSQEDGSFTLNLSQVTQYPATIRIQSGNETRDILLQSALPGIKLGIIAMNSESGATPKSKVAVVMDFYNPIKEVEKKLSFDSSETQNVALQLMNEYQNLFDIDGKNNDVTYPTFYSLFIDANKDGKADIFNYDAVYINSRQESDISQLDISLREQLAKYISNGGHLFITEWTVELDEEEASPDQYI